MQRGAIPPLQAPTWEALASLRETCRERRAGGLVLKHLEGAFGVGRTKPLGGTGWWTWKAPPMRLHAVLVLARHGTGTRAGLYTQGAFALWHRGELVRVAKASRGQANEDARRLEME